MTSQSKSSIVFFPLLMIFLTQALGVLWAQEPSPFDTRGWSNRIEQALRDGKADQALEELTRTIA
jgi:hypothetical protein